LWIERALKDMALAESISPSEQGENIVFHCHQALEKVLMALITSKGGSNRIPRIHDLLSLYKEAALDKSKPEFLELINELNKLYLPAKYPDLGQYPAFRDIEWLMRRTKQTK